MKAIKTSSSRLWISAAIIGIIFVLGGIGNLYQSISAQQDLVAHPPTGELFDVGGYRLHLYCIGQGSPTVILIHGLGGNIYHWALIQPDIAKTTRVCAYDRAGYAWSDIGPRPRSPLQNARELYILLEKAGIQGSLILVGHSWGTNGVQVYAEEYPENVQGIILVDGGIAVEAVKQCPTLNCMPSVAKSGTDLFLTLQPVLFRLGLLRLFDFPQPYGDNLKYLSSEQRAALLAGYGQTQGADTNLAEWQDWDNNVGQVGQVGSLQDIPVRVFMADESFPDWVYGGEAEKWHGYEQLLLTELSRLSTNSQVTVIPNSDHASMLFDQTQWQFVVASVQELVNLSRSQ